MSDLRPPRWLERMLEWALPSGLSGQGTLGDLSEGFERRAVASRFRARWWYAAQAVSLVMYRLFARRRGGEHAASGVDLAMDLRWSFRWIARHPGFSFGVVAVLGLGLGANTAVFSVVDGTLRNSEWWSEPDATVAIWPDREFSFGQLELYRDEQTVYRALGGYVELAFALRTPDGASESVNGVRITPELFRELAVQPTYGRALADDDAMFTSEPVAVLSESLWRRSFGADSAILGTRIDISGAPVTVVGIQQATGQAPGGRAELWIPLTMDPRDDDYWKSQSHTLVGVLRDGRNLDHAFTDLLAFTDRLSSLFPVFYPPGWANGVAHVTRADAAQRRMISTPLLLLLSGTGLLMLVTALNVGNLLLGRAIDRRRELAVRASLGAARRRIVAQLLVEGLVLSLLALVLGLLTGAIGGRAIAGLFVEEAAVVTSSSIWSPRVFAFTLAVATLAWGVLNGVPIAHFLRTQRWGLTVAPDSGARTQRMLVTVQAALATLLLVSASLLVATVDNLRKVPLGFEPTGILTVELSPPENLVASPPVARALYDRLVDAVRVLPGVEAAGLTGWLPLRAQAPTAPINLQAAPTDPRQAAKAPKHMVDPGFFDTFAVEPIDGRLLGLEDRVDRIAGPAREPQPSAIVVNQTLATMLWPDGQAVGQLIAIDPHAWDAYAPVVGVVPDLRSGEITGPVGPALYVSLAETPSRDVTLVVRTRGPSGDLIPLLRRTVREVDPLVPIRAVSAMDDVVRSAYATAWVMMGLLIVLAVLATGLGAIGIYAVLAHHVSLNKREIAVRMALGARPGLVVGNVVRSGLALAGIGIVVGCAAAALSTRFLESLLFEVSALAPAAYIAPALGLAAAAAVAAWFPAVRAGRLPPADVLRGD